MLLALVVSFGIFCSLLGIIPADSIVNTNHGNSNPPPITFRSRTLKQVSEQGIVDVPQLPSTASPSSYTTVVIPSLSEVRTTTNTDAKENGNGESPQPFRKS